MNQSSLLVPIRIPELGPSLGKLVTGTAAEPGGAAMEPLRIQLVTKLIERAGEARRLNAHDERAAALAALGREAWLAAWDETVSAVADRLVQLVNGQLEAEALAVGMPPRLRRRVALDESERRAVSARLGSAGANLIPALDRVDRAGRAALTATALDRDAVEEWKHAQLAAGRTLEAAWLALLADLDGEVRHWRAVGDAVSRWRKPWWPVAVFGVTSTALAVWIGLVWGGLVPVPRWARPALDFVAAWLGALVS